MVRNRDLPQAKNKVLSKKDLLAQLIAVDRNEDTRTKILKLENDFRDRIATHFARLPIGSVSFSKINTSPFVLMFYCKQKGYHYVSQIEQDILPAKLFSSMETSAGRMVQQVVLPAYGWENVESPMHSFESVIDARRLDGGTLRLATLKSGPRCLNDAMSKDIAEDIVGHSEQWAKGAEVDHIDFTYGVLYGTERQSNKKDWHILRNIVEIVGSKFVVEHPRNQWKCSFRMRNIRVDVSIRLGTQLWSYLGGDYAFIEILTALLRACVTPVSVAQREYHYAISDLGQILSLSSIPHDFNVSLIQRSQIEWLFFLARHFCDTISE